jgi:hypothetical protein
LPGNALTQSPVLGWLAGLLDSILVGLGMPVWVAQLIEFVLTGVGLYFLLRALLFWALPALSRVLIEPLVSCIDLLCAAILLPEFLMTRRRRREGREPTAGAYFVGDVVFGVASRVEALLRQFVPLLRYADRLPDASPAVLLVVIYLIWNSVTCYGSSDDGCLSPFAAWRAEVGDWFR